MKYPDAPWLDVAESYKGLHENSPRGRELIPKWFQRAAKRNLSYKDAWCAAFVGICLIESGRPGSGSTMARSYLKYGTPCEMKKGAIAVFSRSGNPIYGHVGFVVGWNATHIFVLGGNQSDRVCVESYPKSRLLGFRWPPDSASQVATEEPEPAPPASEPEPEPQAEPVIIHHETPQEIERRLRESGSRTIETTDDIARLAKKLGIGGVLLKAIEWASDLLTAAAPGVDQIKSLAAWCVQNYWAVVAVVVVLIIFKSDLIRQFRVSDAEKGLHIGR